MAVLTVALLVPVTVLASSTGSNTNGAAAAASGAGAFASMFFFIMTFVFPCLVSIISLGFLAFWIWMLIDVVKRDDNDFADNNSKDQKVIWLLLIIFTSYIGALIYYFVVYSPRKKAIN